MALGQEGRREDGGQEHEALSGSGSCLAVNGEEHSHSKHGPAQEQLGMGGMSSAEDRSIAVAWTCRE